MKDLPILLLEASQRLYYQTAQRSYANWCAEAEKEMVLFAISLFKEKPTTYKRNAKKLLNKCGWMTAAQVYKTMNNHYPEYNKQRVWRILQNFDCHVIELDGRKFYRVKSTTIPSLTYNNDTP